MGSANSSAIVAVKILVKVDIVSKLGVALQSIILTEHRPAALLVSREDSQQAAAQFTGNVFNGQIAT
jgi:hypothetical protein